MQSSFVQRPMLKRLHSSVPAGSWEECGSGGRLGRAALAVDWAVWPWVGWPQGWLLGLPWAGGGGEAGGNGSCIPGGLVGLVGAAKGTLGLRRSGRLSGVRVGGPSKCPDEDVLLQVVPAGGGVPGRVLAEQVIVFQAGQRSVVCE